MDESPQECRPVPEGLHASNDGQVVQTLLGTSQIEHSEPPLLQKIDTKIGIGRVSPIDDANNQKTTSTSTSTQSPGRQKKTQKKRDTKNTSKSESKACDPQMKVKRQSRKASSMRLPTTPLSSTTTTCIATSIPCSPASVIAMTAITTIERHLMSPMDPLNKVPLHKEKKSHDSKRKRPKKSRSSQRTLAHARVVDESMAGNPELPTSNESYGNQAVIVNKTIESQSTSITSPRGRPTVSTNARVQAAKQFLNASRHELPRDQHCVTSDKGQEQKRATKKKLADLSLERESLHNTKPRSSRTTGKSSCSKPTSRKKTKGSRQWKIRPTQNSQTEDVNDAQQQQRTESMPAPNQTVNRRVHSFVRPDTECTPSEVSSRHERRIAARNELEAISTHIRHRSHSRSLRTREPSTRRQVDIVSSLSHGASSHAQSATLDKDSTSPLTATRKSSTDYAAPHQVSIISSNHNCSPSSSEQPMCLASKPEPTQPTEHREHVSPDSTAIDDEVNSFASSLDSHMSQNLPNELILESIQNDALQIIKMLPPKLVSKKQREETPPPEIPNSHPETATSLPSIVSAGITPAKPDPVKRHSAGRISSSLHPRTDLQSFLKHVAVLNDLKALTDLSLTGDAAEFEQSELITASPTKCRRFQRFFQVKCTLFNILRQEVARDADRLRQSLLQHYDIEPMDLDFVLEHLLLCEEENIAIRWDLIRLVFFPEEENPYQHSHTHNKPESPVGHHSMPTLGHPSNILVAPDEKRLWHSNGEFPTWNSLSDTVDLEKSPASSDPCNQDEKTKFEQPPCWFPMEEFQEEILELFESVESSMADLPFEQQKERRLVLVQLLQATSDEEAHMTTLSYDDMAEIVRHIRISRKTNTDVQWDMIRDIVFPFGVNSLDLLIRRADGEGSKDWGCESSLGNSSILHQSFRSIEHFDDGVFRGFDYCDRASDIARKVWDMTGEDLDVVLQHIQVAIENDVPIRWDLIGDILYPGDPDRQSVFSDGILSM